MFDRLSSRLAEWYKYLFGLRLELPTRESALGFVVVARDRPKQTGTKAS